MPGLDRRSLLLGSAGVALHPLALPVRHSASFAADGADALILVLSDLHSAYRRLPATLSALDAVIGRHRGVPMLAVVNGDIFERGNAVALRSGGEADLAFLTALAGRMPVIVNLGNHETALVDDMAEAVRQIEATGARVVTSLRDRRTGRPFAPEHRALMIGNRKVSVVGIGTDDMATYRQPARSLIEAPPPLAWASDKLGGFQAGADVPLILSHAGVQPDRDILPMLPDGTLLIGGHDHLRFFHRERNSIYLHTGSYLDGFVAVTVTSAAGARRFDTTMIEPDAAVADRDLAARIERLTRTHLTEAERAVATTLAAPMPLGAAARLLVRSMATGAGVDVGLINHTTLGTGFTSGPVTAHDLANFIRFDGTLFKAEIDAGGLSALLEAANQDADLPLARRSGDFLYATPASIAAGRRYTIVTNGWVKLNARRYLGREDLAFAEQPDLRLRAVFEAALKPR